MKRLAPNKGRQADAFTCPACGAAPYTKCVQRTEQLGDIILTWHHLSRIGLAQS